MENLDMSLVETKHLTPEKLTWLNKFFERVRGGRAMLTISQPLLTFLLNACWQIALITAVAALCSWLLRGTTARCQHLLCDRFSSLFRPAGSDLCVSLRAAPLSLNRRGRQFNYPTKL